MFPTTPDLASPGKAPSSAFRHVRAPTASPQTSSANRGTHSTTATSVVSTDSPPYMSSWPSTSAAETGVLRAGDEWPCAAPTIHINQAGSPAGLRHQALLIATGDAPSSVQVPTVVTTAADPAELPSSPKKRRGSSSGGIARTTTGPLPQPATQGQSDAKLPKRPKADEQQPKTLPLRYELCAVEDLVDMMAHMLGELIEMNDAIGLSSGSLTRFHSRYF